MIWSGRRAAAGGVSVKTEQGIAILEQLGQTRLPFRLLPFACLDRIYGIHLIANFGSYPCDAGMFIAYSKANP